MQFTVSLTNFRCFSAVGPVRIAPITILIGENSSGKTSFMAAARELVEAFNRPSGTAFNREPYFLGSFEQIAHYRGGKAGRAKSFCLEIASSNLRPRQGSSFSTEKSTPSAVRHRLTFVKGESQPELSEYSVNARDISGKADLTSSRAKITVQRDNDEIYQADQELQPSSETIRRDLSFLRFYFQDIGRRSNMRSLSEMSEAETSVYRTLASRIQFSTRALRRSVFASAPVRIQPRRIYTPSELTSFNAGEQVPLQIANMKLSKPEVWEATRTKLVAFGKKAGLFEDIEIKRFGRNNSDPFQLQIKTHGPSANIVDVGYGVSQALPLIFPLQQEAGYNLFLLQQPEVHLHPRAQAEFGSLLTRLSASNPDANYIVETHSDYILDRIRIDVRDGIVKPDSVSILLFRRTGLDTSIMQLGVDERGEITGHPDDYRSFFLEEQAKVLGL